MKIAIIGAGIQGCSTAMELSSRGHVVHLFDRGAEPMQRASRWNEGKLHLGYVYGRDPSMGTARRMIEGSLDFYDFFNEHLGTALGDLVRSAPFVYLVPKDSMMSGEEVGAHLARCDDLIQDAIAEGSNYIGESTVPRTENLGLVPHYNPSAFQAAFRTGERSIDVHRIAGLVSDHVRGHPRITFHPHTEVEALHRKAEQSFVFRTPDGTTFGPFDRLVNTSWESRLALDRSIGVKPERKWLHRYKIGVHITGAPALDTPSCTMVLGAYGDFVNFGGGNYFLSWYPAGKIGESSSLRPEEWGDTLSDRDRQEIADQTITELGRRIPALAGIDWSGARLEVEGGHIFAWGKRDITNYQTGLHERDKSGVYQHEGGYFSIDTGKYCTATLYARQCAAMITG